MTKRRFYYDTEFIEGKKQQFNSPPTIDLISIGIVDERGDFFYEISNEFDLNWAWFKNDNTIAEPNYWIRENVLKPIFADLCQRKSEWYDYNIEDDFHVDKLYALLKEFGKSNDQIKEGIIDFIKPSNENPVDLVGYYSSYDHVVLCWLFGRMIDLPDGMPMYTIDLKQVIDEEGNRLHLTMKNLVSDKYKTYHEFLKEHPGYPKQNKENKHSALHDAIWTSQLGKFLAV